METGFTATLCIVAAQFGWLSVAFWTAFISLAMYLINVLVMEIPWALIRGHAFGDTSGLWEISRVSAVFLTFSMLAIRLILVWYVPA
jgi:hypothetical protein